jgi:hypothetical protein
MNRDALRQIAVSYRQVGEEGNGHNSDLGIRGSSLAGAHGSVRGAALGRSDAE